MILLDWRYDQPPSFLRRPPVIFLSLLLICLFSLGTSLAGDVAQSAGNSLKITLLFDNTTRTEGTQAGWGFACWIEGGEKTILFDTGADASILLKNAQTLHVDLGRADIVVISHNHGDHTNGLAAVLGKKKPMRVLLPASTPNTVLELVQLAGSRPERVDTPLKINTQVNLVPTEGNGVAEISLVLLTPKGATLITGCAHPGIVSILRQAKEVIQGDIATVLGGFHLLNDPPERIVEIISSLKQLGVRRCAATHCTGEKAIAQFRLLFREDFLSVGVGSTLVP